MKSLFHTLTIDQKQAFVQEKQRLREALYKPSKRRNKVPTVNDLAQILNIEKNKLKEFLLTLPEFSSILK